MVKNEDIFSGVDRIPACDGQTDGQTSCDGIVRTMHTRRAVKTTTASSSHLKRRTRRDGQYNILGSHCYILD